MKKWMMIVDVAKCVNCQNCTLATKDEYVGNDFAGYSAAQPHQGHEWLTIDRHVRGTGAMLDVTYVPRMCNHCDQAPCVRAGRGAVIKRDDGIVIIDPAKAKGRRDIVGSCPYGQIWWNEQSELPQQWPFDAHLLDQGWNEPRCVQACPTGALRALRATDEEMAALIRDQQLSVIDARLRATAPRVLYRNLDRVTHHFVGGNVMSTGSDGLVDNVVGAAVEIASADRTLVRSTLSDRYGDFRFDGLPGGGSRYAVTIRHSGLGECRRDLTLDESRNLGSIELR